MFYKNEEDAQAVELQNYIKENGPEAAVVKYIGLKPEDRMTKVIVEEYKKSLWVGAADVDATLAEMTKRLKAAGMDDLIQGKQEQLDAWMSSK